MCVGIPEWALNEKFDSLKLVWVFEQVLLDEFGGLLIGAVAAQSRFNPSSEH